MGSDTSKDELGMVKFSWPLNVTVWMVSGSTSDVPIESLTAGTGWATVTAVIGRSVGPNALDRRKRMISASRDSRTV